MNYYDTLIEVADDCPVSQAQVPKARGARKTKATVEYELLASDPYKYTEEDIAFEVYAVLHDMPRAVWAQERNTVRPSQDETCHIGTVWTRWWRRF